MTHRSMDAKGFPGRELYRENKTVDVPPATLAWPNPAALQVLHLRQQSDADRFVAAMRTIMSLSPQTAAAIRTRQINPPDATARIKNSRGPRRSSEEDVGLSAPVRQGGKSGGWVRHSQNLALPSLA